jgi:hypothetical protein
VKVVPDNMAMKHRRLSLAQDLKSLVDNQPGNAQGRAFEQPLDQQVCEIGVSVFAVIVVAIAPPIVFSIHGLFSLGRQPFFDSP